MLLEVEEVHKAFGNTRALDGVSLRAAAGEVTAVLGENGAGKSTLMKVLAGAIAPDRGAMRLDGAAFRPSGTRDAMKRGVAMVYQEPHLCPDLTVAENILLGREPRQGPFVDRRPMRDVTRDITGRLVDGGLDPDVPVARLSPGDRQLVSVARALSLDPKLLILDEPTSALTAHEAERLFGAVEQLKKAQIGVLYISHFLEEVEQVADRYTVLRDGKSVGDGAIGEVPMAEVVALMVGQDVGELFPRTVRTPGEVVVELTELAGLDKPRAASLSLRKGEVLGIAGLVGSGRTELLRCIFGLDRVTSGELRVGSFVGSASPARRWASGVGMLSEDRKGEGLAGAMSVADNMTLSKLGPLLSWISPKKQAAAAQRFIDKLRIRTEGPAQPVGALSGGNQQKVALGRLLHHEVDIMLLDEPTRGIDVRSRKEIYEQIDALASRGVAVLVVSSYLPELFGMCDRLHVMRRGRLGPAHRVDETTQHDVLVEATGA